MRYPSFRICILMKREGLKKLIISRSPRVRLRLYDGALDDMVAIRLSNLRQIAYIIPTGELAEAYGKKAVLLWFVSSWIALYSFVVAGFDRASQEDGSKEESS